MNMSRGLTAICATLALTGAVSFVSYAATLRSGAFAPHRNIRATLIIDGRSQSVTSDADLVSSLLDRAGLTVQPPDEIRPPLSCRTFDGMTVNVNTPQSHVGVVRTAIPFKTVYKRTIRLLPGRRAEGQAGRTGVRETRVEVTAVGSHELSRRTIGETIARSPVNRVVLVGTDPFLASRGAEGVGRVLNMVASMYDVYLGGSGSGRTCTGVRARRGIVAVDPRVIPLGSRLYVEGYGYAVAADTGGAIKGHRIDLCVPTTREADRYGMHRIRVVVLN